MIKWLEQDREKGGGSVCAPTLKGASKVFLTIKSLWTPFVFQYADPVANLLDKWGVFRARLFRESCVFHRGNYVKDLSRLGRDLHKVVIMDNSPASYIFHPDNAVSFCVFCIQQSDRHHHASCSSFFFVFFFFLFLLFCFFKILLLLFFKSPLSFFSLLSSLLITVTCNISNNLSF